MKDLELTGLAGIFLGWALASFVLMLIFFTSNFHRWVSAGSFGLGIIALLTWSIVMQLKPKSVVEDAVDRIIK